MSTYSSDSSDDFLERKEKNNLKSEAYSSIVRLDLALITER